MKYLMMCGLKPRRRLALETRRGPSNGLAPRTEHVLGVGLELRKYVGRSRIG